MLSPKSSASASIRAPSSKPKQSLPKMKNLSLFVSLIALGGTSLATYSQSSCESYKIPVTVTSKNNIIGFPPFETDFDVADFIDIVSSRSAPPPSAIFSGQADVTATYTISGTFCKPPKGRDANKHTVLIATHGVNFDRK